jgi:integrase
MPVRWIKTQYPNVRYYEHGNRRTRNGQADKYFSIRYYVNGRQREEGVGWASEGWNAEKAYALLGDIRAGLRTGEGPQSLAEKREQANHAKAARDAEKARESHANMTLEEFFHAVYIPRAKREKRSWLIDEQRIAKAINPALGKLPLRAVQREDVQKFVDALSDAGNAPATVKQYMGIVRRAFYMAAETVIDGTPLFLGKNPASGAGIRLPAVHNSRDRYLLAGEVEKLIAAAEKLRSPDLKDCIVMSLNTGLRMGELMRLRWLDVDMVGGFVSVPDETMRKPGGKVPLNDAAMAVFRGRKERQKKDGEMVFPSIAGAPVRKNLSAMFHSIVEELGLNEGVTDPRHRLVFHSLRHTFASWLALGGTDIYRIKTLMRHKSISMTMRYAHLIPDATRDAVHNLRPPKKLKK